MKIRFANEEDFSTIRNIAEVTWPVAYGHMLSKEQLDYMMEMMYAEESLIRQHTVLNHIFLLAEDQEGKALGFASYSMKNKEGINIDYFHLHKLYILPDLQQTGIGSMLLKAVEDNIRNGNPCILELNVNRNNRAKEFYSKNGFEIIREEDIDIGNGFFMNDYVMAKVVR